MRPARQVKIINLHMDGLADMKKQLEDLINDISNLIKNGESWLQGNEEQGTFAQIIENLDLEISRCTHTCLCIANEKEDIVQSVSQDNHKMMPTSFLVGDRTARADVSCQTVGIVNVTRETQTYAYVPDQMLDHETEHTQSCDNHETQLSLGGEADLYKHLIGCKKNPGHVKFIPVEKFTIGHLPNGLRDQNVYGLIKSVASLTVRVDVRMTSPHRPEFWPKTKASYPFYTIRNKPNFRTGSGMVSSGLTKFTDGYTDKSRERHWNNSKKCWCKGCKHSDTASNEWWEFNVYTASQVVFDDIEARSTSLKFFYDNEETFKVSVDQVSVVYADSERDWCVLNCVTCNKFMAHKLHLLLKDFDRVWWKVNDLYADSRDVVKLSFMVSHPHGCAKRVSVGRWVDKTKMGDGLTKFTYTTSTCQGCAGAPVFFPGYVQLVHSGTIKSGLSCSVSTVV